MKRTLYTKSDNNPAWYWSRGLHDAVLTERRYTPGDGCTPNCLEITLDAQHAMFDTGIRAIRFLNCKELTPDAPLEGSWWVRDSLTQEGKKYTLEITCGNKNSSFTYAVRFEDCQIIR